MNMFLRTSPVLALLLFSAGAPRSFLLAQAPDVTAGVLADFKWRSIGPG